MQRITITIEDELLDEFDSYMSRNEYKNRSEAFRDILRDKLEVDRLKTDTATHCIGCLTYVFNHSERDLAGRLAQSEHDHHDLNLSTLHVHLDHDTCMEAVILRGATDEVQTFANSIVSQRGIRHGKLHLVPAELQMDDHRHGKGAKAAHYHSRPKT